MTPDDARRASRSDLAEERVHLRSGSEVEAGRGVDARVLDVIERVVRFPSEGDVTLVLR